MDAIYEWNKLDPDIGNSESLSTFRKNIFQLKNLAANSVYNCHNPKEIKLITRLQLGLSHLQEHKFKHNFQDSTSPRIIIISKIQYAIVVMNQQLIFSSTGPYLLMKEALSLAPSS